jgi:hypothetical protein
MPKQEKLSNLRLKSPGGGQLKTTDEQKSEYDFKYTLYYYSISKIFVNSSHYLF